MPLATSYVLSKKAGNEAWVEPIVEGKTVRFKVYQGKCPKDKETCKKGRAAVFQCPACGEITTDAYVKNEGKAGRMKASLMAIVAEGNHGRIYISPDEEQEKAGYVEAPDDYPNGDLPRNPRWFTPPACGLMEYKDLFTNRQLHALSTFSSLVGEIRSKIEKQIHKESIRRRIHLESRMLLPDFSSQREKEKYFRSLNEEQKFDALNESIEESEHIVFLGGAGVSTESGIPDFRSKDGLYKKKDSR